MMVTEFKKGYLYRSTGSVSIVVIFTSPIEGIRDRDFKPGFECDDWNGDEDYWNDLGPGK